MPNEWHIIAKDETLPIETQDSALPWAGKSLKDNPKNQDPS